MQYVPGPEERTMKNYALLLVAVAVISTAFSRPSSALELAPMAGARFDSFQTTQLGTTYNSTFGYQFGGLLFFDLVPFLFKLRTGAIFKTRYSSEPAGESSFEPLCFWRRHVLLNPKLQLHVLLRRTMR